MSNKKPTANSGKKIYTLDIKRTKKNSKGVKKPEITVNGKGTDLNDRKALENRAKRKTIAQKVILMMIDDAKKKDKPKWVRGLWNAYRCQTEVVTTEGKLYGNYCKYRVCPICSSIRKAEKINSYIETVKSWPDAYFVTLTVKAVPAYKLSAVIDNIVENLEKIIDKYRKQEERKTGKKLIGIKSLECNFNPERGTYNPHFHIIVQTEEMAEILLKEWMQRSRPGWTNRKGQFIRKVNNHGRDMIETIKYGTKVFTEPDPRKKKKQKGNRKVYVSALNNILMALDGHHVFDTFGFKLPKREKSIRNSAVVSDYEQWDFNPSLCDWIEQSTGERLTGYVPTDELIDILKYRIDTDTE
ncbi:MAG: protein rep [Bacteroidia bacterium]|jgi:hypothetical protein